MSEEDWTEVPLTAENVQELLQYASNTAVLVTLMQNSPSPENLEELVEKFNGFSDGIARLYFTIPECIVQHAHVAAAAASAAAAAEEEAIEQLREDMKDL